MVEKSEIHSTEVDKMEVDSIDSLLTDKPLRKKLAFGKHEKKTKA